jgi:hypothetical protein
MPRGFDRPLYIPPFDHRGSFQTKMFGWRSPLSDAQTAEIASAPLKELQRKFGFEPERAVAMELLGHN